MLQLQNISLSQGRQRLLESANATVYEGEKVALIGRNGVGKSSLFSLINGQLDAEQGEIKLKSDWKTASLAQELPDSEQPTLEFVMQGDREWAQLSQQICKAEANDQHDLLADLYENMQTIDGFTIESRAAKILIGLGFAQDTLNHAVNAFSGGWRMRIQLARVLITRADFMMLDEPTNHLDLEAILWLEKWLIKYAGTVLMISHDREFIDNVAKGILHMQGQTITRYTGNYTSFEKQYLEAKILIDKENQKIEAKRAHLQHFVDRFKAKASKAKQAQGRIKMLQKLTLTAQMQEEGDVAFSFFESEPAGNPLVRIEDADFAYQDTKIFEQLRIRINDGQRIGLIGPNGAGKSTFMGILAKTLSLSSGTISFNKRANIGYFTQNQGDDLDQSLSPLETLMTFDPNITEQEARNFLGRFKFRGDKALEKLSQFSGGQRARLALALLIWQKPNVLLLDEPTNHLDLQVREALMIALQGFQGTLILISHDRALLNACVEEFWLVGEQTIRTFSGDLDDYALWFKNYSQAMPTEDSKDSPMALPEDNPTQNQSKRQKELDKIDKTIIALKAQLADVDAALSDQTLYEASPPPSRLQALTAKRKKLLEELQLCEQAWLKLADD